MQRRRHAGANPQGPRNHQRHLRDDKVKDYIVDLVCATRDPDHYKIAVKDFIQLGASPARPSR